MMLMSLTRVGRLAAVGLPATMLHAASVMAGEGRARDWQIGLQEAATPVAEQMHNFHNLLLVIVTIIVILVMGLMGGDVPLILPPTRSPPRIAQYCA